MTTERDAYDVEVLASLPEYDQFSAVAAAAVRAALAAESAPLGSGVAVRVVDDSEIEQFHIQFMDIPGPTDVISWPSEDTRSTGADFLGDIMLSAETAQRQALEHGHPWPREIAVLAAHGTLHLLGWDDRALNDRRRMQARVDAILDEAGIR